MTLTLQQHVAAVLADPLAAARSAMQPIGFVGADLPPELALATGRVFSHLPWQTGRATPRADAWLESSFPGWARSMVEDWADGYFDLFDAVVFTRGDDAAQRLYYYICELQRRGRLQGPRALMLDAALIPRDSSVRHCRRALQQLLDELGLGAADIAQGIAAGNLRRHWYRQLATTPGLPGVLREQLGRASLFQDIYPGGAALTLPPADPGRPLLLAGSAPPDERLHAAVAEAGWNVGSELHGRALLRFGAPIEVAQDDPLLALARRLNAQPWGPRSFVDRQQLLHEELDATQPAAAVLWLTEEDESIAWDLARLRTVLQARGIPALVLTRRRWALDDGASDAIRHFLGEL
jgi:hypothetical protein